MMQRRSLLPVLASLPLAARAQPAWTPDHPIRILVGFAAGGSTDTTARIIAQALGTALGQQVVVENRTGAGGNVASEACARSAPDGYTLVMGSMGTHAVNQSLYPRLPFHVARDFSAISLVVLSSCLLVVHPSVPANSVAELIALAKARPGRLNCGTGGGGTSQHIAAVLFEQQAGVRFTPIHYRGGAPAMADLVSGRVDLIFAPVVESITQYRAGQVRALGITWPKRAEELPEVPAVAETVPGYDFQSWLGLFAPAGTPVPVVARLSEEVAKAARQPAVAERLQQLGYRPVGSTAEEFASFQLAEIARMAEVVRVSGASVE
ncbi:tripartite tricarboxylate transporter substrate binding protein [Siccirubricoccus sp. KC 17139]|uniref:Tripartite tricarboxylate transporter substrate binding protein n=1 Tax=Siccirubricoccus soli TaxID=2899147 RepID=A0ABT1DAV4_9PROT|nr:tripartite tricarboxylate transporter substrate binding protein [Siccirubricoccus soli]MCO6418697.1 tripartite tricarboxylate transporter substrate binding protein [Siccirubricoccus soli]MCP2684832.1 tripartite tricarboxylate transporter substrate binding protein [Siccirubricoccus soli]